VGRWGINWVRTLAGIPQVDLRVCCDANPDALHRVRHQYPHLQTTASLESVCNDPAVEGVIIATPAPTHYDLARQALMANKHVLVEKPLTLCADNALALTELAEKTQRLLMVGHLLDYHPALAHLKQLIDRGELGDIHYVYSQRLNLGIIRPDENAWWSLAPHDVAMACRLLGGAPLSVQCRGQQVVQPGVADVVFATLEFPGRRLAHIHVSWLDPHKTRKLTVVGSQRMAVFDDTLPACKLTLHDKGYRVNERCESYADWISMRQGDITMPKHPTTEPLLVEAEHFVECIRSGRRPISDGATGTLVVRVLERGQQSMDQGGKPVGMLPQPQAA
jgi:predicted dehydrogenase